MMEYKNLCSWLQGKEMPSFEESYLPNVTTPRYKPSWFGAIQEIHSQNINKKNFKSQWEKVPVPRYSKECYPSERNPDKHRRHQKVLLKGESSDEEERNSLLFENSEESLSKSEYSVSSISDMTLFPGKNIYFSNKIYNNTKRPKTKTLSRRTKLSQQWRAVNQSTDVTMKKRSFNKSGNRTPANITPKLSKISTSIENDTQKENSSKRIQSKEENTIQPTESVEGKLFLRGGSDATDKPKQQNKNEKLRSSVSGSGTDLWDAHFDQSKFDNILNKLINVSKILSEKPRKKFKTKAPNFREPKLFCRPYVNNSLLNPYKNYTGYMPKRNDYDCVNLKKSFSNSRDRFNRSRDIRAKIFKYYKPFKTHSKIISRTDLYSEDLSSSAELAPSQTDVNDSKRGNPSNESLTKKISHSIPNYISRRYTKKGVKALCTPYVDQHKHLSHYAKKGSFLSNMRKTVPFGRSDKLGKMKCIRSTKGTSKYIKHCKYREVSPFSKECFGGMFKRNLTKTPLSTSNVHCVLKKDKMLDSNEEVYSTSSTEGSYSESSTDSDDQQINSGVQSHRQKPKYIVRRKMRDHTFPQNCSKRNFGQVNKEKRRVKYININKERCAQSRTSKTLSIPSLYLLGKPCKLHSRAKNLSVHSKRNNEESYKILKNTYDKIERIQPGNEIMGVRSEMKSTITDPQNGNSVNSSSDESDESYVLITIGNRLRKIASHATNPPRVKSTDGSLPSTSRSCSSNYITLPTTKSNRLCPLGKVSRAQNSAITDAWYRENDEFSPCDEKVYTTSRSRTLKGRRRMPNKKRLKKRLRNTPSNNVAIQTAILPYQQTMCAQTRNMKRVESNCEIIHYGKKCFSEPRMYCNKYKFPRRTFPVEEERYFTIKRKVGASFRGKRYVAKGKKLVRENRPARTGKKSVTPLWENWSSHSLDKRLLEIWNSRSYKVKRKNTPKDPVHKSSQVNFPINTIPNKEIQTDTILLPITTEPVDDVHLAPTSSFSFRSFYNVNKSTPRSDLSLTDFKK